MIGVGLVVALGVGIAIGAAAGSKTSQLNADNAKIATLQSNLSQARSQLSQASSALTTAQAKVSAAQSAAANAATDANQKAASAYASRVAALAAKEKTVAAQQQAVNAQEGQLQANQISGDGVYVVGKDIKSGTWHTNGSGNTGQNDCYFATLNSTDTSNIADNNNFDGPETVDVSGAYAFQVSGPCTWVLVS